MKKGKFIVIEGLDGSGATTQVGLLVEHLRNKGIKTYSTKEPTDNVIGGLIRGVLSKVIDLSGESLQLLFSADRGHHLRRMIEPALKNGSTVICDRYMWSTIAFGSIDTDKKWLLELQKHFRIPDLTIILRVNPKKCIRRMKKDRFDFELFEEEGKLRKVWRTYLWLKRKYPKKIVIVDGERSKEEVSVQILTHVNKIL